MVMSPPQRTADAARRKPGSGATTGATRRIRPAGTVYRGREGMWSWVLHRITGIAIFFFLFAHVLDTALVRVSPEAYNRVIDSYKNPVVGLMETGLVAAVLYHAFNGLRLIAVDFWSKGPRYQRQLSWAVVGVSFVLFVPFAIRHLANVFGHGS
jgi:succinate dehydrogenase / fumarate reductase cytochrome b subunit